MVGDGSVYLKHVLHTLSHVDKIEIDPHFTLDEYAFTGRGGASLIINHFE